MNSKDYSIVEVKKIITEKLNEISELCDKYNLTISGVDDYEGTTVLIDHKTLTVKWLKEVAEATSIFLYLRGWQEPENVV